MGLTRRLAQPLLAASFVAGGVETLLDPGPRIQRAREAGLDEVGFGDAASLTRANAAVQIGAGAMLATNRLPRLSALVLAASLLPTTYAGHPFWSETDKQMKQQQRSSFLKNLGLLGGLIVTALDRTRRESLVHRARHKVRD
jgi:putative oxidoreductase